VSIRLHQIVDSCDSENQSAGKTEAGDHPLA
jgi:hypothetical protein